MAQRAKQQRMVALHPYAGEALKRLVAKVPQERRRSQWFRQGMRQYGLTSMLIWAAIDYLDFCSPYGLEANWTPASRPASPPPPTPEKTRRPVLRLIPAGTGKEG